MERSSSITFLLRGAHAVVDLFSRWFPRPHVLLPPAAGIDISDASIKWVVLGQGASGVEVRSWGHERLPAGVVVNGVVQDIPALTQVLGMVRGKAGIECAHAA